MKEACPKCRENGQDTAGDNLHRYPDGGAYCFACGYYEGKKTLSLPYRKKTMPLDATLEIEQAPEAEYNHLLKYLTKEELNRYFRWSPKLGMYVFTHCDADGSLYWEARKNFPKKELTSSGKKPFFPVFPTNKLEDKYVIVEDLISAIKVGRICYALPLFGSEMKTDWINTIIRLCQGTKKEIIYWLDSDKTDRAIEYLNKTRIFEVPTKIVMTPYDPKEYTTDEIREWIK